MGLIKNLALSQTIIPYLCEQNAMRRLGELIINLDRSTAKSAEEKKQFDLLMEITIGALINLSKHSTTRSMMREINCQSVLIRVSMQISSIASLLFFLLLDITSPVLCFTTISQCFTQRIKYRLKSLFFCTSQRFSPSLSYQSTC